MTQEEGWNNTGSWFTVHGEWIIPIDMGGKEN